MTDILTEIIACKQIEIELQKAAISKEMLINNCNEPMPRISMRASLASSPYGIISEFKRRSPSRLSVPGHFFNHHTSFLL